MEKQLNATDIWEYIESHHKTQGKRFGKSYSMTLNNGLTYLYQVLPDGRLLGIDNWFEGYVEIFGSIEAGIHYAVIFNKCNVCVHEYIDGMLQPEPTAILKYTKKEIDEIKAIIDTCPPIRIRWQYSYNGQKYWIIDSYDSQTFIYNISEQRVTEKYRRYFIEPHDDYIILYRFPFAPYRYGIVSNWLALDQSYSNELFLMDFEEQNRIKIGTCTRQKFFRIIEFENDEYLLVLNGVGNNLRSLKFEKDTRKLLLWPYNDVESPQYFNNGSKVKLKRVRSESCPFYSNISDSGSIVTDIWPFSNSLAEFFQFDRTIFHIHSDPDQNILLSDEFIAILKNSHRKNDFTLINGKIDVSQLSSICRNFDAIRLRSIIEYVNTKMLLPNYILKLPRIAIEILAHDITYGDNVTKKVKGIWFYNSELKKGDWTKEDKQYKEKCQFDISIRFSLFFDSREFSYNYDESYENDIESKETSLDSIFEKTEELYNDSPYVETEQDKTYRYIVYKNEFHECQ